MKLTPNSQTRTAVDHRGVSEVMGFILVVGLLVAGLSIVQTYGVPAQNEQIEFEHSLRAQGDTLQLAEDIETVGGTGASRATSVEAGTGYPSRLFLLNPPAPTGTVRTGDLTTVTLTNATAAGDAGDYWDGQPKQFTTRPLVYQPDYNVYGSAPTTVIEHGLVYNDNPSGEKTIVSRGPLVRGDQISLVTVNGTFNRASTQTLSVEAVPVSAPSRTVTVTPSEPMTLSIQTGLSASEWEEILAEEQTDGHVTAVTTGATAGTVNITFEAGVSYDLRLARVGIDSGYGPSPDAAYLTATGPETQSIAEAGSQPVTFELRDAYNNPVSGVPVSVATRNGTVTPATAQTDGSGEVTFTYTAPAVTGAVTAETVLNASVDTAPGGLGPDFDVTTATNASRQFSVVNTDSSGVRTTGTGEGGESEWTETENSEQITVANGRWNNITQVESVALSDGELVTTEICRSGSSGQGNGANVFTECKFVDTLRLSFTLTNTSEDYTADVVLQDCNGDGDYDDACTVDKLTFAEERSVTIYDGSGTAVFESSLTPGAADDILGSGTNILDGNVYVSGSQGALDDLKLEDATWLTSLVQGRVTITITAA